MSETKIKNESKQKTEEEKLFRVLLHNDDHTTMDFVVCVLMSIFDHTEVEAEQIMLSVHNNGIGVAGIYNLKVAEDKAKQTMDVARIKGFLLKCSVEFD